MRLKRIRFFFLPLFIISVLCNGKDTLTHKVNGKYIITVNTGLSFPEADYGSPQTYNPDNGNSQDAAYGLSFVGFHMDVTGIYLVSPKVGLVARFGVDENSTVYGLYLQPPINKVSQYLTGVYLSINPNQFIYNISFFFLAGLVSANIPISNEYGSHYGGDSYTNAPGIGYGYGFCAGIEFDHKIYKKFYFNCSFGYLISEINFPNTIQTDYTIHGNLYSGNYSYTSTTLPTDLKMDLGIIQTNIGISFHL